MPLPPKLQEIVDDFADMTREEKLETLISYAETFPSLPERFREARDKMEAVPECMTPVFLFAEKQPGGGIVFHVDCPPQSPTVRGLAMILVNGLNGSSLEEILSVPADFFLSMKLDEAVSQQRLHGFMGVLAHMKQSAVKVANE
jgi:cysteine desulfuration protein SufE